MDAYPGGVPREIGSWLSGPQSLGPDDDGYPGERLGMPHSRPMPSIGSGCHELRIRDRSMQWRIVYRVDADALLILAVFQKTTPHTPPHVIDLCKRRIQHHDTNQPKE